LLPRSLISLSTRVEDGRVVPHYLTERDEPWLRALLDEHARYIGRKRSELEDRLRDPLPVPSPRAKLRAAIHVLDALGRDRTTAAVPPREARWSVFRAASADGSKREVVLGGVAKSLGVTPEELEASLFADLRGERRVAELPANLSPWALALETNRAMVCSLLKRASHVRIAAWGSTRALVRHARLMGLICVPSATKDAVILTHPHSTNAKSSARAAAEGIVLDISGPFALFRHTEVYGRALASLVPRAAWCNRFEITAACALGRGSACSTFIVRSGDPIGPGRELARYDSRLEERFAKDFGRAAPQWDVIREPQPVVTDGTLIFPDFELAHRHDPERRWLLEIVGFWTREYLLEKLRRLRAARLERLILCIDEKRACRDEDLPVDARIIRYRNRIDPRAVLAIVDPADP
jgi:hypothetical protein